MRGTWSAEGALSDKVSPRVGNRGSVQLVERSDMRAAFGQAAPPLSRIFCLPLSEQQKKSLADGRSLFAGSVAKETAAGSCDAEHSAEQLYKARLAEYSERGYFFYDALSGAVNWSIPPDTAGCVIRDWTMHWDRKHTDPAAPSVGGMGKTSDIKWDITQAAFRRGEWLQELEKNPKDNSSAMARELRDTLHKRSLRAAEV